MGDKVNVGESHSPVSAIKTSPTVDVTMDFSRAIEEVIIGKSITKQEWGNKDEYGLLKDGWLMIHHAGETFHKWIVSEADLQGTDWIVIQQPN